MCARLSTALLPFKVILRAWILCSAKHTLARTHTLTHTVMEVIEELCGLQSKAAQFFFFLFIHFFYWFS